MSDAQQAREDAALLALISDKLRDQAIRRGKSQASMALSASASILDTEHDRLLEEAADLESEGERA